DLGPGAGTEGGRLMASGPLERIKSAPRSLTGQYLRGERAIPLPLVRRPVVAEKTIRVRGARKNNLKNVSVEFPLGTFICVTGVSGSGKSTLILDTLYPALMQKLYRVKGVTLEIDGISGLDHVDKVVDIDQSPIGQTPRSNPATYVGIFGL